MPDHDDDLRAAELKALGASIAAAQPAGVVSATMAFGELTLVAKSESIIEVLTYLRDTPDCLFINFIDLTAVDYPQREKRFDVVYHALSPKHNRRIRVKTEVADGEAIASAIPVWPAANWFERETYDLMGVLFSGHPDLRRILTDYGFEGHPLRKDFPMTGYVEVRYDDEEKRVVYEPVKLNQEYRQFDFLSPWEGNPGYVIPGDEKAKQG